MILSDKTILITGAGRGIGASTALLAAKKGYQVCVNYRSHHEAANYIVDQIRQDGGKAFAVQADVSREEEVIHLFQELDKSGAVLKGLVNNAGILETQMKVVDMSADRLQRILANNVTSCFLCAREAIKRMSLRYGGEGGAIVNVSSVAARTGSPGEYVDYAASKGAIDTFTVGLAIELAEEGIRVNGVRPGFIYTDIHASGGEAGRVDRIKQWVPMKRGGYPKEVAMAILWLLSEEASYSSGTFIDISGGR